MVVFFGGPRGAWPLCQHPQGLYAKVDRFTLSASSDSINVLIVTGKLTGGGIQNLILEMLRFREHARCDFDVCTMADLPGELTPRCLELGAHVYNVNPRGGWRRFNRDFGKLLRSRNYSVVHAIRSGSAMALPIGVAARCDVPIRIAHYQNVSRPGDLSLLRRAITPWWRRTVLRDATQIVGCAAEVLGSHFHETRDDRFRVIPNAIDTTRFGGGPDSRIRKEFGIGEDEFVIGNIARFSEAKNHRLIVDVAEQLCAEDPRVRFLLIGDGPLRSLIETYISERGLEGRVICPGWSDDVPGMLSAMDVFFFPSRWEGFGIALLEAEASGLPCVTSNLPVFEEVLAPGLRGFSRSPDDEDGFVESLRQLISDSDRRGAVGAEAKRHAAAFDIRGYMEQFAQLYRQGATVPS